MVLPSPAAVRNTHSLAASTCNQATWENRTEASNTDVNVFQTGRTTAGRVSFSEVAQVATDIAAVLSRGQGNERC